MRVLVVIAALASAAALWAQDEKPVQDAIKGLGAESFEEREKATADLKRIGAPALDALRKAAKESDDPEVRVRAQRLVEAITKPATTKPKTSTPGRAPTSLSRATIRQTADGTTYSLSPPDGDAIELQKGPEGRIKLVYPDGKGGKAEAESESIDKFVTDHKALAEKYGITKDGIDYGGTRLSFSGVLRAFPALPPVPVPGAPEFPEFRDFDEFFKQSEELRKAFEDLRRWRGLDRPGAWGIAPDVIRGAQFSAVPDVLRSQLSIPEGQGVVVEAVREGTTAAAAGLKRHDVILEIDGKKVTGPADIRTLLTRDSKVKALRGGKEQALEPPPPKRKEF